MTLAIFSSPADLRDPIKKAVVPGPPPPGYHYIWAPESQAETAPELKKRKPSKKVIRRAKNVSKLSQNLSALLEALESPVQVAVPESFLEAVIVDIQAIPEPSLADIQDFHNYLIELLKEARAQEEEEELFIILVSGKNSPVTIKPK